MRLKTEMLLDAEKTLHKRQLQVIIANLKRNQNTISVH